MSLRGGRARFVDPRTGKREWGGGGEGVLAEKGKERAHTGMEKETERGEEEDSTHLCQSSA